MLAELLVDGQVGGAWDQGVGVVPLGVGVGVVEGLPEWVACPKDKSLGGFASLPLAGWVDPHGTDLDPPLGAVDADLDQTDVEASQSARNQLDTLEWQDQA